MITNFNEFINYTSEMESLLIQENQSEIPTLTDYELQKLMDQLDENYNSFKKNHLKLISPSTLS